MAVTYTRAVERDAHRTASHAGRGAALEPRLAAISVLAIVAVIITGAGRLRSFALLSPPPAGAVNLNAVTDPAALEAVLAPVFEKPADVRLGARELFGFIVQADGGRRRLANVGALAGASVPA